MVTIMLSVMEGRRTLKRNDTSENKTVKTGKGIVCQGMLPDRLLRALCKAYGEYVKWERSISNLLKC